MQCYCSLLRVLVMTTSCSFSLGLWCKSHRLFSFLSLLLSLFFRFDDCTPSMNSNVPAVSYELPDGNVVELTSQRFEIAGFSVSARNCTL